MNDVNEELLRKANPKQSANFFKRLFFCWLLPIFKKNKIGPNDLYDVLPKHVSESITNKLEKILQPLTLMLFIQKFNERVESDYLAIYGCAVLFLTLTFLDVTMFNHISFALRRIGISTRVACTSLLYRKVIKLSQAEKDATKGRLINLITNDSMKLEVCYLFLHTFWALPIQTIIVACIMCTMIGYSALIGVIIMLLQTIPIQAFSGRYITRLRKRIAVKTDERLSLMSEILRGIQVIKAYTWEKAFEKFIKKSRKYEMDSISFAIYLKSTLWAITSFSQKTPLIVTIIVYSLQSDNVLTPQTIFTLVQFFNILHVTSGSYFLRAVNTISEATASITRMQDFLLLDELVLDDQCTEESPNTDFTVTLNTVSVPSTFDINKTCLQDVNLSVKKSGLHFVVGPIGAGKTTLLKVILSELKPSSGAVRVSGSISYSSQQPWLFSGTIKSNILFGEVYNEERYRRIVKVCSLQRDFDRMPRRDETVIGDEGLTLSGGQCARISLARAVYKDADVYVLDDPFTSVDPLVGKSLMENCVRAFLKDKTRIIVTHQLQYLTDVDEIIYVDNGRIEYKGEMRNIKSKSFSRHFDAAEIKDIYYADSRAELDDPLEKRSDSKKDEVFKPDYDDTSKMVIVKSKQKKHKIERLDRKIAYLDYITAGRSSFMSLVTLLTFASSQFFTSSTDYFVAHWTKINYRNRKEESSLTFLQKLNSKDAIMQFGTLMSFIVFFSVLKTIVFSSTVKRLNTWLHDQMIASLLFTRMQFFHSNDSGKILNIFSKDLGVVDERLPAMLLEYLEYAFIVMGIAIQIVIVQHWLVLLILIIGWIFWHTRIVAIDTIRILTKLEAQAKSPMLSHVNSTFAGLATIRSRRAQALMLRNFDKFQDDHTAAASLSQFSLIAYNFWLDLVSLLFLTLLTFSLLTIGKDDLNGADVGLALTQAYILCGILARAIKLTSDIESSLVSLERSYEYTILPREELVSDGRAVEPGNDWPNSGQIVFEDVSLRYSVADEYILKNLTFKVEPGYKVGIVGRTGAGKSSIAAALFRFGIVEGTLLVDNVDVRRIPLKILRERIAIVPQKATLFNLTLRKNLDPLERFADNEIWSILREIEMKERFSSLDGPLDGGRLSAGQCQLLCLARAMLVAKKILVLDEPAANTDPYTEELIQRTVDNYFTDCTVLTITHRSNTITDRDLTLKIDNGRIV